MSEEIKGKRGRKPKSPEAPVTLSVDKNGEDLGDVTDQPRKTPVIEADGPVDPEMELDAVLAMENSAELPEVVRLSDDLQELLTNPELGKSIQDEIDSEIVAAIIARAQFEYPLEEDFKPILLPTMVRHEYIGYISCPRAVFDLVKVEGWQSKIDDQPAHVKAGLKSVLYWKRKNNGATVRCHSSSKFGDVV